MRAFFEERHDHSSLRRARATDTRTLARPVAWEEAVWGKQFTRRQLLKTGAAGAGAVGAALSLPRAARGANPFFPSPLPSPIPGGLDILGNGTIYHVLLPGYPPLGSPDPATNDPAVITDWTGHVGLTYVRGTGTRTDKRTGATEHLPFEVDLRFMQGTYASARGRRRQAAFALI